MTPTEVRADRRRTPRVWRALAHPVRRRVLDMLSEKARTTGEVCAAFPRLSRFAVMKHLRVLEAARLVLPRKDGRQVWNHLNAVPLREVYERWVGGEESKLAAAVLRLRDAAERAGPIGGSFETAPPTQDRADSASHSAERTRAEVVVPGEPGEVWPAIRTRAMADLIRARFLDDLTIEGEWGDVGEPVTVRVGVAPAAGGTRVSTSVRSSGRVSAGVGALARAVSWCAA